MEIKELFNEKTEYSVDLFETKKESKKFESSKEILLNKNIMMKFFDLHLESSGCRELFNKF